MPVSSYPRVTVQGTGAAQNPQNGQALMILNPSTGKYEAATSSTFAGGGGGGGDATAANQTTQINEAQNTNTKLDTANNTLGNISALQATAVNQALQITEAINTNTALNSNGSSAADWLYNIANNMALGYKQDLQITEATNTNNALNTGGFTAAEYLQAIKQLCDYTQAYLYNFTVNKSSATLLEEIRQLLVDIKDNQTNQTQVTQIYGNGYTAHVNASNQLEVKNNG